MLSKATVKKLRKVVDYIREEPLRLDMQDWGYKVSNPKNKKLMQELREQINNEETPPPCGTVGCLAGSAIFALSSKTQLRNTLDVYTELGDGKETLYVLPNHSDSIARDLLGLNGDQADALFLPWNTGAFDTTPGWPSQIWEEYQEANEKRTPKARAKARFKALERAVETFIAADGDLERWHEKCH